jgi:hypothetical protein
MIKFKLRYQKNTKQIKFFRTFDHIKMQMFRTNALSSKKKKKKTLRIRGSEAGLRHLSSIRRRYSKAAEKEIGNKQNHTT